MPDSYRESQDEIAMLQQELAEAQDVLRAATAWVEQLGPSREVMVYGFVMREHTWALVDAVRARNVEASHG